MFSKFRSLIFKIDPETAHNLAIKSLKLNLHQIKWMKIKMIQCSRLNYLVKK